MKHLDLEQFARRCASIAGRLRRLLRYGRTNANRIGSLAGRLKIKGDLFSTGEKWDA